MSACHMHPERECCHCGLWLPATRKCLPQEMAAEGRRLRALHRPWTQQAFDEHEAQLHAEEAEAAAPGQRTLL